MPKTCNEIRFIHIQEKKNIPNIDFVFATNLKNVENFFHKYYAKEINENAFLHIMQKNNPQI